MTQVQKQTLYSTEGGADKQYTLWIEAKDDGFVVQAQWGPRGGTVQSGTKTPVPVPLDKAQKVYDKVVSEKLAKGYHAGADAPAFSQVANAVDSGLRPMLLTDASEQGSGPYIDDDRWFAQQKMNGKRIMLSIMPGAGVVGVNRRGLLCPIPAAIEKAPFAQVRYEVVLDGELIGDVFHVFDMVKGQGGSLSDIGAASRHLLLSQWICLCGTKLAEAGVVEVVPIVVGEKDKQILVQQLRDRRQEGVVFKRMAGCYVSGRIENLKKAIAVKVKFYAEGDFLVLKWNDKSSIEVAAAFDLEPGVHDVNRIIGGSAFKSVGNVTVHEKYKKQILLDGVVRVKYLYATPNRILYQPNLDPTDDGQVMRDEGFENKNITKLSELKLEGKGEEE